MREVENQIGLIDGSSSCIIDTRDQRYIDHTIKELITQRVFQIAAGYEDCNDSNDLRSDMNCKVCADRLPQTSKDLGSQLSMSRLENAARPKDLIRMGRQLLECFVASYSHQPRGIIIDCDDTNNNTYGPQEVADTDDFKDGPAFAELETRVKLLMKRDKD